MSAVEHLKAGDIELALSSVQSKIRSAPADSKLRTFLFQLLAVKGDWNRARRQLDVLSDMDADALPMVHTYREALTCEALREGVFAGEKSPLLFGQPEAWMAMLIEALAMANVEQKADRINQAFEAAPAVSGSVNGEAFTWIADADARLGPMLEAVVNNSYYWVPFHRLSKIVIEEPVDLRDSVWMPAYFTFANEGETVGLIPTRYAASSSRDDSASEKLARTTSWYEFAENRYLGSGQRILTTDVNDYPIMECREILIDSVV